MKNIIGAILMSYHRGVERLLGKNIISSLVILLTYAALISTPVIWLDEKGFFGGKGDGNQNEQRCDYYATNC